jgi:hypothetical protein
MPALNWLVIPYQEFIYIRGYANAIAKRPHLKEEIVEGADFKQLLDDTWYYQ